MVQACTIIKISVHIWCRKTVILEISECEKRVFWQSVASDHSRNVNGNELVNFNLVQKKIIHFIKKILEVRASVIITDGTICTTAFVTYSQIQYNSTILFNYCMVLYCTHRSLDYLPDGVMKISDSHAYQFLVAGFGEEKSVGLMQRRTEILAYDAFKTNKTNYVFSSF